MSLVELAGQNMAKIKSNPYPGRGIVLGQSPDGKALVQIYWIMGRSANSRNRIFEAEGDSIKTKVFDESKVEDPSLIIYYPVRVLNQAHIVTNGDQTDTIYMHLAQGGSFETALNTRTFEPDAPNYTPRISGLMDLDNPQMVYQLAILKAVEGNPAGCQRNFYNYETAISGIGHCIHTYANDGNPLPSFQGEPYPVQIYDTLEENARVYWDLLNPENRIALMVKMIDPVTRTSCQLIFNKHLGD